MTLNKGDIVRLKSSGQQYSNDAPIMTVYSVDNDSQTATCSWFNTLGSSNYELKRHEFSIFEIDLYKK